MPGMPGYVGKEPKNKSNFVHDVVHTALELEPDPYFFQRVYLEVTNVCNLRCSFCTPTSRPPAIMDPDFFAHCVQELQGLTNQVALHVLGEPLTHPHFPKLLNQCRQANLAVNLTTNGFFLERYAQLLLQSSAIRQINFSLQSLPYQADGGQKTLKLIFDFCHQALAKCPDLYINLRLWNLDTLHQAPQTTGNEYIMNEIANFLQKPMPTIPPGRKSRRLKGRLYVHQDTRFTWPTHKPGPKRSHGFCHGLSTHIAILVDGTVCPCCLDSHGQLALGNIHEKPLSTILSSPQARAMRQGFAQGQLITELCQQCTFCHRFTWPQEQTTRT